MFFLCYGEPYPIKKEKEYLHEISISFLSVKVSLFAHCESNSNFVSIKNNDLLLLFFYFNTLLFTCLIIISSLVASSFWSYWEIINCQVLLISSLVLMTYPVPLFSRNLEEIHMQIIVKFVLYISLFTFSMVFSISVLDDMKQNYLQDVKQLHKTCILNLLFVFFLFVFGTYMEVSSFSFVSFRNEYYLVLL